MMLITSVSTNWETADRIPCSSPPERTECGQGSSSYHCSTRGVCSTDWNYCPIDAGKYTPQAPPSSDVPVLLTLRYLPPSLNLIIDQGGPPDTSKISQPEYSSCSWSSILTYLFWSSPWWSQNIWSRSAYVVSGPGFVTQALRKTSCIHSVILLVDKIRHSNFHWILPVPFSKSWICGEKRLRRVQLKDGRR